MLSFKQMLVPIWDTDIIYGESFTMVREADGTAKAPFLYPPLEILRVENAACTECYEEGTDWYLEDGQLCLPKDSRIFAFTPEELYPRNPATKFYFPMPGGNLIYCEDSFFHDRQISVTYTCKKGGWNGVTPVFAEKQLPRTIHRLQSGQPLNMVLYGDSISWGYNASRSVNASPYQAGYGELLKEGLHRHYHVPIHYTNTAIAGKESAWGLAFIDELVNDYEPELVILAFGMNDGLKTPEEFAHYALSMVSRIREKNPDCEIIFTAPTTPNPLLTDERAPFFANQPLFYDALLCISEDPAFGGGIAVADFTGMQAELHRHKRFIDTTGNNVNHPNDFFHRCLAQFLYGMLTKE